MKKNPAAVALGKRRKSKAPKDGPGSYQAAGASGWTPARKAAQSARMKATMAKRRDKGA